MQFRGARATLGAGMRIALVVPDLHPTSGGPAQNVPRLAEALAAGGADVQLHTSGATRPPESARVRYHWSPPAWPPRLGRSPGLRRSLRECDADVVHANCLWMLPLRYAVGASRRLGAPLVICPRGMLAPWARRRSRPRKALASLLVHPGAFAHAAGWHATSEMERDELRAFGVRAPICVAPNGIDTPAEDPELVRRRYLEAAPELAGKRVALYYSRFHSKKRVVELLGDFASLPAAGWHLLLVGIPEEYSVAELRDRAAALGIGDRATVLDGRGLPPPYSLAELLVLPSHSESFGQVVLEALARGVPVLTTSGTPWRELSAREAGECVELGALRGALARLLALPPDELRRKGSRGRAWAAECFGWSRTAGTLLTFLEELRRR
jgi:glycosyltransferase involved in cell wall biosynthesis